MLSLVSYPMCYLALMPPVNRHMRRLFRLSGRCLSHEEPLLLVGETGCGKTTVCQLYSMLLQRRCVKGSPSTLLHSKVGNVGCDNTNHGGGCVRSLAF